MCGRYALFKLMDELDHFLGTLERDGKLQPNYNAAPTSVMPVCHVNEEGNRVIYPWYVKWLPSMKYQSL